MRIEILLILLLFFIIIIYKPNIESYITSNIHSSNTNQIPIIHLKIGNYTVTVEVVDKLETITLGLMYRNNLPENNGMLFIFDEPIKASFWNKNTQIALDIAFIDSQGTILEILQLNPYDETLIESTYDKVLYAIELNKGWFNKHNIVPGMKIYKKILG